MRPTPVSRAWDFLKGGRDIKDNFKEGNLNKTDTLREKSRYEDEEQRQRFGCVQEGTPCSGLQSFDTFAFKSQVQMHVTENEK